jgi:hypothetical protein
MALLNDIHTIIVSGTNANFSAHSYTEVYAGTSGATPTINGVSVNMAAGSSIKIVVRSISNGGNTYLLGENINTVLGTPYLGGYFA